MIYFASQDLADIFIEFGFTDKTKIHYPNFFELIRINGYDPEKHKRYFSFGNSIKVYFDRISIIIEVNGTSAIDKYSLSENELDSILIYSRMSYTQRITVRKKSINILSLIDYYESDDLLLQQELNAKESILKLHQEVQQKKSSIPVY